MLTNDKNMIKDKLLEKLRRVTEDLTHEIISRNKLRNENAELVTLNRWLVAALEEIRDLKVCEPEHVANITNKALKQAREFHENKS